MLYERRKDPLTDEWFYPKRYNQKFANRENQIAFNNIKARKKRHEKIDTDRILDKNREILKRLLRRRSEIEKSKDYLLGAGFNFNYFSGIFKMRNITLYAVYEFTLSVSENNKYKISKQ